MKLWNAVHIMSSIVVSLGSESKGSGKQITIPPVLTEVSIEIFSRFFR